MSQKYDYRSAFPQPGNDTVHRLMPGMTLREYVRGARCAVGDGGGWGLG